MSSRAAATSWSRKPPRCPSLKKRRSEAGGERLPCGACRSRRKAQREGRPFARARDEGHLTTQVALTEELHGVGAQAPALLRLGAERPLEHMDCRFDRHH